MESNITISGGDNGRSVEVPQHVYEEFLSLINGTEVSDRLTNGTTELANFWNELKTLAPNYASA